MKKHQYLGGFTIICTIAVVLFLFWWIPPNINALIEFSLKYPLFAPLLIISWRILSIVVPPIPGAVLGFAFIPIIGWFWAFVFGFIGELIGATFAFYIARRFREPAVARFIPLQKLHAWEGKLSKKTEFLAFLGIRVTTGPIMDFISYVAGLSKINFRKFIVATFFAGLPSMLLYFLGAQAYEKFAEKSGILGVGLLILAFGFIYYLLKYYEFFKNKKE